MHHGKRVEQGPAAGIVVFLLCGVRRRGSEHEKGPKALLPINNNSNNPTGIRYKAAKKP